MQRIYEPEDLLQANLLINMLANEGIQAHIQGADLVGGMGELPALGLLAIWTNDEDVQKAISLIQDYEQAQPCADEFAEATGEHATHGTLWC